MDSPEADSEELFSIRFKMVLDKLECNENQAALLQLVTRQHEDESDAIAQAHLRLHARDLCAILLKMLNTLTAHNKIIMMITEAHYVDTLSWDLLLELAVACPRLAIFSYARPESTYESKENRRIYKLIEQLPRSRSLLLTGLSQEETSSLILATWTGHTITSVDPKIAESIYKRTDGNPFFIRSLVLALKESGQCRISPTGALTTPDASFDFDKLVLGYDNQSIILAQFDRLDRNFQLFLKVASVLGQKFALDDVLFFLTNTPGASEQLDKKKYAQIIVGLQTTDKYGFLQRESLGPDGQYFIFKSAVVRKCIYNLMVHNQRQQIHLLIAQFLEGKINEQNKHRYVVPILDHYMNTSAKYQNKRLLYTEMAANYFSEKESNSDSIKYFKQLLEIIEDISPEELKQITSLQVANWHRELGNALLIKDELSEAEQHLLASLKIMGVTLPEPGYKFKWAMYKQLRKRAVLNKTFFQDRPVPQEEDYTQSYVARKGASGYSLSNIVTSNSKDKKPESTSAVQLEKNAGEKESSVNILPKPVAISPAQQIIRDTRENILAATQHALVILAEVFLKQSNFPSHDYTVLLGLNLSTEKSTEVHISRLFALGALSLKLRGGKDTILPAQYMEAAVSFDQRVDIHTSLKLVVNGASLLLLGGQLEACNNKLEVVSYLSGMAGDLQSRVFGLHLKATLQTHSCPRETALTTARVLYTLSSQRESRIGKVWGCYHIIQNLLGDKTAVDEILLMVKEMKEAYSLCSDQGKINMLPVEIAMESTLILVPHFTKFPKNLNESLTKLCDLIPRIPFFQWLSFVGMSPLALALNAEIFQGPIEDAETLKLIQLVCDKANVAMKSIKGLALHGPIRRMFKGIKLMAVKKNKAAAKAWMKANDENAEDLLTQATIHSAIAISGEDTKDSAGKVEDIIRDLHVKAKFAVLFPQN
ncbi:hypothetical protein BC833DRAFT_521408 [Globomyces pollinis-pini]|nr:hypothetical protein BC833DRAFT_521408 [Globomyces pollinis-pini]